MVTHFLGQYPHPTQTKEPFTCNPPKGNQPPLPIPTKPRGVPLPIVHSIAHANHTRCALTHCTFDSSKPRGASLPHRGYTFDSAGLASATQPTLGNNASEDTTPLGGCTFSHHTPLPHAANRWFPARKLILKSTMPMA